MCRNGSAAHQVAGGPDKKILKIISELKVGSRLEVEWLYEERFRVMGIKLLKTAEKNKK